MVVAINMALLTELDPFPSPKMRVSGSSAFRNPQTCRGLRFQRGVPAAADDLEARLLLDAESWRSGWTS
jgi:hypothetical protein